MFTGIVTDVGTVESVRALDGGKAFTVSTAWDLQDLAIGASVAHSGVCLTVTSTSQGRFTSEAWAETLAVTTLGGLEAGDRVNLERSLKIGDELGGHLVSGHVDGIATILSREEIGEAVKFEFEAPDALAPFVAQKGSVCLDGVSLTVNGVAGARFDILAIRHTLEVTALSAWQPGTKVNIEVDRLARYAARYHEFTAASR
jgi:riboflavin synthase